MELWTAIGVGFIGSFHCVGMCGPIALSLPGGGGGAYSLAGGRLLYNFGRIVTYAILGAVFGLIGHSAALAGFQQVLSVILGMLVVAFVAVNSRFWNTLGRKTGVAALLDHIKRLIGKQYSRRGSATLFTIGLFNGLLPCGFVYIGLAGSLTTGSVPEGSLYMILFGLGTFPAMLGVSLMPGLATVSLRQKINKAVPVLAVGFGIYLILRGLLAGVLIH